MESNAVYMIGNGKMAATFIYGDMIQVFGQNIMYKAVLQVQDIGHGKVP